MGKSRLEAFSDGVIAILITIMVLELKLPAGPDLASLRSIVPTILIYLLSFVFLGIYWNNHHHMLHATERISGSVLWANLHLLFWLSLVPYTTRWMGETHFAALPTATYGIVLLCAAIAYTILQRRIIAVQGTNSKLASAVGNDIKGYASLAAYVLAIPAAFVSPWISCAIYAGVAMIWLIPDRRIEQVLKSG
jgi:uncharacterized membrane protein